MSPILFELYLEPLCKRMLNDREISGINLSGAVTKVMAYASDLTALYSSTSQLKLSLRHIDDFCRAVEAQMNSAKPSGASLE